MTLWKWTLVMLAAAIIAGCASKPKPRIEELQAAYTGPYRLDAGDQVRVTVFGQDDLTRVYPVDVSGNISMPLIGTVSARGSTPKSLAASIAAQLSKEYLRNPDVSVEVQTYRPFFVLGEVQRAGQFPYVSGMTAQTAIAIAGGYTYRADRDGVTITRQGHEKLIRGYAPNEVPIMPGDTIYVDERLF